ncbi:serine protease, S1-C subfamily, contains C-terminal PDZ domain [Nitrosovibrio sp. Nv4]|nr:serine protease, S1-C subfamily, contains C-terminal PDZ domain [Nitrosovibrio sp. Nv4]
MLGALASALLSPLAAAKTAEEIFTDASPFVVSVDMDDVRGKRGSGVVMETDEVITTCDVAGKEKNGQVSRSGSTFKAVLEGALADRNLCRLNVPDMQSPRIALGTAKKLRVGQPVYAIGIPAKRAGQHRREPVLNEGVVSSLRPYGGSQYIRISAAIPSGFSGGALFDNEGQLIGILSPQIVEGENLAFALPVDWIGELQKGAQGVREGPRTQSAPATINKNGLNWLNRTLALEKKGKWRDLLKLSQQEIKRNPANAAAWFNMGIASANLKQYNQAIDAYREAIRNQAEYADAWHHLGVAYANLEEYADAIQAYEDALFMRPDNAGAWFDLGNAYYDLKRYAYAIHAYRQALRIDRENSNAWYSLGVTYDELKLYDESAEAYRETVRIQPENADAWYNLGVAYAMLDERGKMREIYQTLRKLDPARAEQYFNIYILP